MNHIQNQLANLAIWCKDHGIKALMGYSSKNILAMLQGGSLSSANISDDDAMLYCRLLCGLRADHPLQFKILQAYYFDGCTMQRIAKRQDIDCNSESHVKNLLHEAERWIAGAHWMHRNEAATEATNRSRRDGICRKKVIFIGHHTQLKTGGQGYQTKRVFL